MHVPSSHEVETHSGLYVDVSQPDPATINLSDVAHALSNVCRYGGHCKRFYSVAEHAVFVSKRLERKGLSISKQLAGLHHDDAEAFLGDIPRPIKPLLGAIYGHMTDWMDRAIILGLELPFDVGPAPQGLPWPVDAFHDEDVKAADNWSLFVEARYLLPSEGKGWLEGHQGSQGWELGDLPSRIVTPDYWRGGLIPSEACASFLDRHAELTKGSSSCSSSD